MMDYCSQPYRNRPGYENPAASGSEIARWGLVVGLLVTLILGYAYLRMGILETQYGAARLRKENSELSEFNDALRVEQSTLSNPEIIDQRASSLGLIDSSGGSVRIIEGHSRRSLPGRELLAEVLDGNKVVAE